MLLHHQSLCTNISLFIQYTSVQSSSCVIHMRGLPVDSWPSWAGTSELAVALAWPWEQNKIITSLYLFYITIWCLEYHLWLWVHQGSIEGWFQALIRGVTQNILPTLLWVEASHHTSKIAHKRYSNSVSTSIKVYKKHGSLSNPRKTYKY